MTGRYDLGQLKILVLEDNERMLQLLVGILKALNVKNVKACTTAEDAFQSLPLFAPDLVVTDWHMIPVDGLEFIRWVRTSPKTPNPYLPIIMVTAHTEFHRIREARDTGVNEVLAKPISAKSLYSRILHVVEHPRPFIRTADYFGPDRRRKDFGPPRGVAERRAGHSEPSSAKPEAGMIEI